MFHYQINEKQWEEALRRNFLILEDYRVTHHGSQHQGENASNVIVYNQRMALYLNQGDWLQVIITKDCDHCHYGNIEITGCPQCHHSFPEEQVLRLSCKNGCQQGQISVQTVQIEIKTITYPLEIGLALGYRAISFSIPT